MSIALEFGSGLDKNLMLCTKRVQSIKNRLVEQRGVEEEAYGVGLSVLDRKTKGEPLIVRKARAFRLILLAAPIEIREDELIVGAMRLGSVGLGSPFPEYATEEEKTAALASNTSPDSVWGHSQPDYPQAIRLGLIGLKQRVRDCAKRLREDDEACSRKREFYQAVDLCLDALGVFANKYANLASELASKETEPNRARELAEIARICAKASLNPPETFHEGLQFLWFLYIGVNNGLNFSPLGRFDQYLYPLLRKDVSENRLSLADAQELVDCFWLKCNERSKRRELACNYRGPDSHGAGNLGGYDYTGDGELLHQNWFQNIALGGQDSQGNEATNVLTFLCLNATQKLRFSNPALYVRLSDVSPSELVQKSCELIRDGLGMPTIYNDDVIVPALARLGIPIGDARDYTADGCWEALIMGKTEYRHYMICALNSVETALNQGYSRITSEREGIETADPYSFSSFDEIMDAFKAQLDHSLRKWFDTAATYYGCLRDIAPTPFFSSLISDCIEKGQDLTEGGARYIIHTMFLGGLSHTADSLMAIKQLVFEDGLVALSDLLDALGTNFERQEELRQLLLTRAPKYGNDCDEVDMLAKEILDFFVERVKYYAQQYKRKGIAKDIIFDAGAGTFENNAIFGKKVGATPDGRLAGAPISTNLSPSIGRATHGPTAAINSYTKLDHLNLPNGTPIDLALEHKVVEGDEGLDRLVALVKSFLVKNGNMLTISINDPSTLREAQRNPDQYQDIIVHVAGWQAYFVDLTKEHQDLVIARLEQYVSRV